MTDLRLHSDGNARCGWCGDDEDYVAYHDDEWGIRATTDDEWYEKVCLEGFQSGLSWITILRRRDAFREVFANFDPDVVSTFTDSDVERLVLDERIIRHRGKISSTINNAKRALELRAEFGSLDAFFMSYVEPDEHRPHALGDVPAQTDTSRALAKELRRRGWTFVGPTTMYAMAQSMGLVNDHLIGCWRRDHC
ncbi:MAG: DNA-3-methyladenine glycosylase I [Actinomycetota bacterium]|nr:DNA-3-methyladenine glycosylase I [Actinomycetota bacterium]MEC7383348.1 DNA-3-methyladenine glycosylase I [Actinomycetota bacterium]MEC7435233.1 DNA-3-methyladenine glycosylase I [Actinomycetota bacterium]MEC8521543.1 DNA-3-methyladenine glycosylase I [Actinomycetota bacterium]MEC8730806.1 DNA-3-methyladenine glycosylase I [Actinomycetota bacterium]